MTRAVARIAVHIKDSILNTLSIFIFLLDSMPAIGISHRFAVQIIATLQCAMILTIQNLIIAGGILPIQIGLSIRAVIGSPRFRTVFSMNFAADPSCGPVCIIAHGARALHQRNAVQIVYPRFGDGLVFAAGIGPRFAMMAAFAAVGRFAVRGIPGLVDDISCIVVLIGDIPGGLVGGLVLVEPFLYFPVVLVVFILFREIEDANGDLLSIERIVLSGVAHAHGREVKRIALSVFSFQNMRALGLSILFYFRPFSAFVYGEVFNFADSLLAVGGQGIGGAGAVDQRAAVPEDDAVLRFERNVDKAGLRLFKNAVKVLGTGGLKNALLLADIVGPQGKDIQPRVQRGNGNAVCGNGLPA